VSEVAKPAPNGGRLKRWLHDRPDEIVLQWAFRGLLIATFVILGLDLADMQRQTPSQADPVFPGLQPQVEPYLPSIRQGGPMAPGVAPGTRPETVTALRNPVKFELVDGGRLRFDGAIEPGAAERFAEEIGKRGDYIKTVVLNSPGGSVADALVIATMIREAGFNTEIAPGSYCASSCPLVFAGGKERLAAADASIGVHRVFAADTTVGTPASGMDNAQQVSAECQRFLLEMGVDPRVWIYAMETPKDELFYFTSDELMKLNLATVITPKVTKTAAKTAKAE
jgi:hypothetical protein